MKRVLKRLLNRRGSVLFLVLVVMSLLIIAASATYYVVNNQHNSVNIRYSSEQSYQTALSVSQTISDYIDGYGEKLKDKQIDGTNYEDNILAQLVYLNVGDHFDATQSLSSLGMGDITVSIEKIKEIETGDENSSTEHYFAININVDVNGETVTVTEYKSITTMSQVKTAEPFTRFLTSTEKGIDSRDVFLAPATIYGDAFFENEWTQMTAELHCSLYSSKSFVDSGIKYKIPTDEDGNRSTNNWEIVIGENFTTTANSGVYEQLDNVFVGGDMTLNSNWNAKKVYINGNLEINYSDSNYSTYFVNKDCHIKTSDLRNDVFYVNGDLYFEPDSYGGQPNPYSTMFGKYYVKGKIYFGSNEVIREADGALKVADQWGGTATLNPSFYSLVSSAEIEAAMYNVIPQSNNPTSDEDYFTIEGWDDVTAYISETASKNEYMDWDAEGYFLDMETKGLTAGTVTPGLNNTDNDKYSNPVCTISESCRLKQAQFSKYGYTTGGSILINANTEPLYIYLEPETGASSFRFGPDGYSINVLIQGEYPVIFILPKECDFIMNNHSYIGHVDLAIEVGGFTKVEDLFNVQNANVFAQGFSTGDPSKIQSLFTEDPADGLLKYNISGTTGTLHNNIFLVTMGDGKTLDFGAQSTFGGYIYAPKCNLQANYSSQSFAFIGGLVVSNYTYKCNVAHLIFTSPYDYYGNFTYNADEGENAGDIVNKLMEGSGAKKPGGESENITVVGGVKSLGYK